jgi:hypothetical protein
MRRLDADARSRDPEDNSRDKDRLEYYIWLAKLADKGKIASIFFADGYGLMQTYEGKPDATFRGGSMVAYLDPVVLISAMAAVSKSVAFGITSSTSYTCIFSKSSRSIMLIDLSSFYSSKNLVNFGPCYERQNRLECGHLLLQFYCTSYGS